MGCGASKDGVPTKIEGDKPVKAPEPSSSANGSAQASAGGTKARRKTTTPRRAAVSTGATDSSSSADVELVLVKKSDEVTAKLLGALESHPLFEHLAKELMHRCIEAMVEQPVEKNQVVIKQGDSGDHFYVVYSGTFEAYAPKPAASADEATPGEASVVNDLDQVILQEFSDGQGFGELALLYNSPRACSVRATSDKALTYSLDRTAFRQLVMSHNTGLKHGLEQHLAKVPLLSSTGSDIISKLADVMTYDDYSDGEYIVQEKDEADCLYLILLGEVVCHRGEGEELMRLAEGSFFGESCLSESEGARLRQANVVAVGRVRVGVLKAVDFQTVCPSLTAVMNVEFNRKAVQACTLLAESLTPVEMDQVVLGLVDRTTQAGESIIEQGQVGTDFYIIRSGAVDVLKNGQKIASLGAGDYFGERALLTEEKTVAAVIATEPTQLMTLGKAAFERVLPPLQDLVARCTVERDEQAKRAARPKIHFKDLKPITVLGEGTFGRVRLMQWKNGKTKVPFALKTLQKGQLVYYKQVEHVVNEKRVLGSCCHPFILKLEATYSSKHQVYMLLEIALGGELFTHLRGEVKFAPEKATLYAAMVASAFSYLHARKIAHRDLKPENLLFDEMGYLKLVDFGFAKIIKDRTWTLCGTPEYLAPEIISNRGHNCGVDWWTLGILIYEMLVGEPPFVGATQLDTYHKITRGKYKMPTNMSRVSKDFISRLLMHNPSTRLGCAHGGSAEVLGHDFFAEIPFQALESKSLPVPFVPTIKDPFDASNFDQYGEDDGASQWYPYNKKDYDPVWSDEFGPME